MTYIFYLVISHALWPTYYSQPSPLHSKFHAFLYLGSQFQVDKHVQIKTDKDFEPLHNAIVVSFTVLLYTYIFAWVN